MIGSTSPPLTEKIADSLFGYEFFDQVGKQFGIVLLAQMFNARGGDFQLLEGSLDILPLLLAFFSFRQVKFGNQFAEPLQRYCSPILVVIFDDALLIL